MISTPICLRVRGPFACFTRPEFHVERVSYPVITPSAARGILEAILMKPIEKPESGKRHDKTGFRWHILRLGVVDKGTLVSILRNELGYQRHPSYGNAKGYDIMEVRAQRHSLILKGVEYLIEATIEVCKSPQRRHEHNLLAKYHQMFLRRARAGQCYYQPFLGCREFSVSEWEFIENPPEPIPGAPEKEDFGFVFRDFDFDPVWRHWGDGPNTPRPDGWTAPQVRPTAQQALPALAKNGWIRVAFGHHDEEAGT